MVKPISFSEYPTVSVIIPCLNEQRFIAHCLGAITYSDYPKEKLEILVVDGMSKDGTREIIQQYEKEYPFIKLVDNPQKITPIAMNLGIQKATGQVIMVMGAHAVYEKDYITKCIKYLYAYDADNIGGVMLTKPSAKSLIAQGIALTMSSQFGVGNSIFRTGSTSVREVDTVFGGCYKRDVFDKIGLFNEQLIRSQDMELNVRLKKAGGKILLHPDIKCYYYARSTLKEFVKHVFKDGQWAIYPLKFGSSLFYPRHMVPLLFVSTLITLLILALFSDLFGLAFFILLFIYIFASTFFGIRIALAERDFHLLYLMPLLFGIRHFVYGFGSLFAIFKIIFR
ncbi:MAG: glycosyltransferase family 2 protein [Caldilineaceae bacterium]